jgi:hypothetical protein
MSMEQFPQQSIKSVDYFFPHRTTTLYHFEQLSIDPIKIVCLYNKRSGSAGVSYFMPFLSELWIDLCVKRMIICFFMKTIICFPILLTFRWTLNEIIYWLYRLLGKLFHGHGSKIMSIFLNETNLLQIWIIVQTCRALRIKTLFYSQCRAII